MVNDRACLRVVRGERHGSEVMMDKERGEGKSGWGFVLGSSGGFREGQVTRSENLDYFGGKVARGGNVGGFGGARLRGAKTWTTLGGQVTRGGNLGGFGGRFWASLGVGIPVFWSN